MSLSILCGSYTLKGKTDFLLSYEQISLGTDLSLNSIILGVEHLLLKQKSRTPINLHLSGNYLFGSVGGDGLSDLGVDLSSSGYEVGAGISYAIGTTFRIVPYAKTDYKKLTLKASGGGISESDSDDGLFYSLGTHIGFKIGKNIVAINPFISFGDIVIVGLKLSYVLGRE